MDPIVATYAIKVTLRSEDGDVKPPTNEAIAEIVGAAIEAAHPELQANATSERTDI